MDRAGRRGAADRLEIEKTDFYARVREGYLALAKSEPHRFIVIDASRPLSQVQADIAENITGLLSNS
jgi:dTMP kinase